MLAIRRSFGLLLLTFALFASTSNAAERSTPRIGLYLSDLGDFDIRNKTFVASFWLWSSVPAGAADPLADLDFPTAAKIDLLNSVTVEKDGKVVFQKKYRGVFRHDWQLANYPFNRIRLVLPIEAASHEIDAFEMHVDRYDSGIDPDISVDGWRIDGWNLEPGTKVYASSFGVRTTSEAARSEYARLSLGIDVVQIQGFGFFTMIVVPITAMIITLASFLLPLDTTYLAIRAGFLTTSLLSTVLSFKLSAGILGSPTVVTLVDGIHLIVLSYMLCMMLLIIELYRRGSGGRDLGLMGRFGHRVLTALALLLIAAAMVRSYLQSQ